MSGHRKYKNPPVVEALCELFFTRSVWDDTVPGQFYDLVKEDFPTRKQQEIRQAEVMFSLHGDAAAGVRTLPPRMQFISSKGDRMIQLGRDVLVVNQLPPYPRFMEWEPDIYKALRHYRELAKPQEVARLGVRYINRVIIPEPRIHMEDYFTVYPNLPKGIGDEHGAFMIRFELPKQLGGHTVIVTFASAPTDQPDRIAHLLDLYDIFEPGGISLDDVELEAKVAHANLEAAFEGSITDRLRELFGKDE